MKLELNDKQVDKYFNKAQEIEKNFNCPSCKKSEMIFNPESDYYFCRSCQKLSENKELTKFYEKLIKE